MPILQAGHGLIKVPVKVNGVESSAIVDTGAIPNIISTKAMRELNLQIDSHEPSCSLRVANGNTVIPAGTVKFKIEIGKGTYDIECCVLESFPYDILLGMEFLMSVETIIYTGRKELWIGDAKFAMDGNIRETDGKPLRTRKRVHLPPHEVTVVCVNGRMDESEVMMIQESEAAESRGLIITHSLNKARKRKTIVGVRNNTDHEIILPKGLVIAQAFKVNEKKDCHFLGQDFADCLEPMRE